MLRGVPGDIITSVQNPRVKNLVKLRDRGPRDEQGVFLVEGFRALTRALDRGVRPRELFVCREWFLGENEDALIARCREVGADVVELGRHAFAKAAYRDRPEGLLAVVDQWHTALGDLQLDDPPFLLVVESIEKPGNLGTILRSADAAGIDAVIVCDPVTDLFNPNVVRSSTGVLFAVAVALTTTDETIAYLRARQIRTVATTPGATQLYSAADLRGPLALVMGSEQFGLGAAWLAACDESVRIPMAGQADSLNVAMATIVTLFEAVRQRQHPAPDR
jgi:TrmH family RNA methyltransferase